MDTTQESAPVQPNNDISIAIDIHRETGLIVVDKIGIPDQGIELTVEDVEALSAFVQQHGDRLAHSSDFQESVSEEIHQPGFVEKLKAATDKVNKLGGAVAIKELPHHADVQEFKRLVKIKKSNLSKWEKNVNEAGKENSHKCHRCKDTGQLIGKGQFVKGIKLSCPKCGDGKVVKENDTQQFDVESDDHWKDEKMIGLMKQKDVGQGHGTLRFKSNTGTTYTVELDRGKILSLKDHRGNEYELPEIQKYWEKGFPLIGAIAATIGDPNSSGAEEDEKQSLYPPEELQETDKEPVKEKLPRKRCERCGKPVNPGISSTKCPSCHESDLSDAEKYYGVEENMTEEMSDDPSNPGAAFSRQFISGWENSSQVDWNSIKIGTDFLHYPKGAVCKKITDNEFVNTSSAWGGERKKVSDKNIKVWVKKQIRESGNCEVNPLDLTDIEVDGINKNDWPDFVDSYVVSANHKGRPLTPQQIEWLNQNHPDVAQDVVREKLGAIDFDKSVREGGLHVDKGQQISPVALSEEAPPGFPKSIYEKLVIKFKGNKDKINEVMWELHNRSKKTGSSLDEKTPPNFPKSLHDKLLLQYKAEPEKAYAIMWKLHNEHGDKLESVVNEATNKIIGRN